MKTNAFARWLRELDESGNIAPVRLGMTRGDLRSFFGEPEDVGGTSRRQKEPLIWRYASVEFHFGPASDAGLNLIYEEDADGVVRLSIPRGRSRR